MLPKHWGGQAGGSEVAEQLAAKAQKHRSLLLTLGDAGVLPRLASPALRCCLLHCPLMPSPRSPSSHACHVGFSLLYPAFTGLGASLPMCTLLEHSLQPYVCASDLGQAK